ncbi:flagellar biosynthetic protein FliR [Spongiibacter taiwanensis]|uniref:flagellar biosynthetic protein FliR n=1 Tax=Spongiibacter taiwanensis TaxID=1748242 RepID=UPI002035A0BB|nr:flagellar biosynthetic protein FliR [Spongiibacter taiwanensis]USA43813.1 flagellar biosynthetic protein FliR [Spongiibacter taiwanensis]
MFPGVAFSEAQMMSSLAAAWLPFMRIGGALMTAPLFSAAYVPMRIRLMIAIFISAALLPFLNAGQAAGPLNLLGIEAVLLAGKELLIGICLGFFLQLVFDAILVGGHLIANGMGLGFAMMVDPQRGVQVPVLSQYLLIVTMLLFVVLDGHLAFLAMLVRSFQLWPVAGVGFSPDQFGLIVAQGGVIFSGAIQIAIPAVIALLLVQISIGVISRAAPTLNLFAVGFPLAMLVGFLLLERILPSLLPQLNSLLNGAYDAIGRFLGV